MMQADWHPANSAFTVPARLVFLLRAFHGLAYYLEGLGTPIFWQRALKPHAAALSARITDLPLPAVDESKCDFGSLDGLLDEDVKQRIHRRGIDLAQIVSNVRRRGNAPTPVFNLVEGAKHIEVWLE